MSEPHDRGGRELLRGGVRHRAVPLPARRVGAVVVGELSCKAPRAARERRGPARARAAHHAWDFAGHALLTLCLLLVYAQYAASSFAVFAGDARCVRDGRAHAHVRALGAAARLLLRAAFESRAAAQVGIAMLNFAMATGSRSSPSSSRTSRRSGRRRPRCSTRGSGSPSFSVAEAMLRLVADYISRVLDAPTARRPLRWEVGGRALAYMGLTAPVFFALAVAADGRPRQERPRGRARARRARPRAAPTPPPAPPSRRCRPSRYDGEDDDVAASARAPKSTRGEIARHDRPRPWLRAAATTARRRPRAKARQAVEARAVAELRALHKVPVAGRALARRAGPRPARRRRRRRARGGGGLAAADALAALRAAATAAGSTRCAG